MFIQTIYVLCSSGEVIVIKMEAAYVFDLIANGSSSLLMSVKRAYRKLLK